MHMHDQISNVDLVFGNNVYPFVYAQAILTMKTVLLNLFQLVAEVLFIRNQPPQPLLGILNTA